MMAAKHYKAQKKYYLVIKQYYSKHSIVRLHLGWCW